MSLYRKIKGGRVIVALIVFILTLSVFVDLYEWIPSGSYDSILYLQFVPSVLNFIKLFSVVAAGGFVFVLILTFVTGRIYCSVICPLGILQDVITYIAKRRSKKKRYFRYKKAKQVWRFIFLAIMVLTVVLGAGWIVAWLDPYSIAGRFFTNLIKPLATVLNNILAALLTRFHVYALHRQNLPIPSVVPVILTFVVTGAIGYFAWKRGRLFCNTICPVGTLLGVVSKYSFLKVQIDQDACTRCGKCAGSCKSECIDVKNYSVDNSRCVMCFNCLDVCPESALSLRKKKQPSILSSQGQQKENVDGNNRRKLLVTGFALLAGNRIYALKKNKMPDSLKGALLNEKDYPVSPPGSVSIHRFNEICTSCSLCVAACPTHVLQPALAEYGLSGFMQPHMDYSTNFCNFDCTKCGEVCPTGAILPLLKEEKHVVQAGKVVFVRQNCVVYNDETDCGACSEHCPTKAVDMVPYKNGLMIPEVDQSICIGCGACEHTCPVEAPYKAIYVNGNAVHQKADKPVEKVQKEIDPNDDFPF